MTESAARVYNLSDAHPDGWFEEVLAQSEDFEKACEIIGRTTLGLALIAGARILSLTANPHYQTLQTAISQNRTNVAPVEFILVQTVS